MNSDNCDLPSHHGEAELKVEKHSHETIRLLYGRASCRSYESKDIPESVLNSILKAGIHAPTGGNLQPYSIIKIKNASVKKELAEMCGQEFIGTAPVNLLFCLDWHRTKRWAELETAPYAAHKSFRHFWIGFQDVVISAQNICTAADALGLGSVYIGTVMEYFDKLRDKFDLPEAVLPVVLLCLGYPKKYPDPRKKLGIETIVHDGKYIEPDDHTLLEAFNNKYTLKPEINEERLEQIYNVASNVGGKNFATKCINEIKNRGYINMALRYFGLHYVADFMCQNNDKFVKSIEAAGFNWFKPNKLKDD